MLGRICQVRQAALYSREKIPVGGTTMRADRHSNETVMDRHGFARYEPFTIQKSYIILRNLSLLQIRHSGLIPEHRDTNTFFDIELGKRPTNRLFDCLQLHSETLSNFSVSHSFADQC